MSKSKSELVTIPLILSLAIAVILRVLWMISVEVEPVSDSAVYDEFARSLAKGRGFAFESGDLTAYWPVGTSAVYSVIYLILGFDYLYIEILNLFLGCLIVWLGWMLCRDYFDVSTANIAALILAFWPLLIQFTTVLSSELLFIVMMLIALLTISKGQLLTSKRAVLFGVLVGLGIYVKPILLPIVVIIPYLKLMAGEGVWQTVRFFIISSCVVLLVAFPWSYRNTQVFGEFTTMTTNFGPNLWMGNNPDSDGSYMALPQRDFANEKDRENELKRDAIDFISQNPVQFAFLAVKRLVITFSRETIGVLWNRVGLERITSGGGIRLLKIVSTAYWLIVFALSIAGLLIWLCRLRWRFLIFSPVVISGFLFSVPLIIVGQDRYHMPMIPFISFFAASAISTIVLKRKSKTINS